MGSVGLTSTTQTTTPHKRDERSQSTDPRWGPHPFTAYLQIVSFTATITISVSISASQGFATAGTFFGIVVDRKSTSNAAEAIAVHQTANAAKWLTWSAAVSSLSLIITLILQLLLTDDSFLARVREKKAGSGVKGVNLFLLVITVGSWTALLLQGAALAFIGQGLKAINNASGTMIQVCSSMDLHAIY